MQFACLPVNIICGKFLARSGDHYGTAGLTSYTSVEKVCCVVCKLREMCDKKNSSYTSVQEVGYVYHLTMLRCNTAAAYSVLTGGNNNNYAPVPACIKENCAMCVKTTVLT